MNGEELKKFDAYLSELKQQEEKRHESFHKLETSVALQNQSIDTLKESVDKIMNGLYGTDGQGGLAGEVNGVKATQARQKGYMVVVGVISGLLGRFFPKFGG
jgi:NAD(P)H-hydrate repair Nnr-like enzyme with NAD(P)H-hydrate epimerase domain